MELNPKEFINEKIKEIKDLVKKEKVVSALSGGVDSATATVLAFKAIGEQLKTVFIDDGLMRENECENVVNSLKDLGINVELVKAENEFFNALKGIKDPEEKRKAFRNTFYIVLGKIVKESKAKYLVQGTIKVDILEAKGGIKSQHNVLEQIGIDPKKYGFTIIEPLKEFYKNEVREIAKELGLPVEIYQRMPFPGPGLAIRIVGEVTPERVSIVRKAAMIVEEEIKELKPFQAFAVLLKDKATGLTENKRNFGGIIAIRSVESKDAMTASVTKIPYEILEKIQKRIINEIPSVVKVLYDITPKPPSTIEYI